MAKNKVTHLLLIILSSAISCRHMWGDNDLGDNFSLLEGDRIEDRIIVYCSGRSAGACMAGTPIVPIYSRQFDKDGHYAEYVETAKSNGDFIIAKTLQVKDKKENYWIINKGFSVDNCTQTNCDSTIQTHVFGPFDQNEFQKKISELKINLKFDNS
jgi:hypothetical protein